MSTKFGLVALFKGYYYSNQYSPEGYTVRYYEPGSKAPQNRTCATLPPEVVNRCAALDMVSANDTLEGVGHWDWTYVKGIPRYVLDLWAPIEDIFDLDPR